MEKILLKRRTQKVLADAADLPIMPVQNNEKLEEMIAAAGNAPFHFACDRIHMEKMTSPVPWRARMLDAANCRKLLQQMISAGDTTKVPNMLAAAAYLVQVTWLPDAGTRHENPSEKDQVFFDGTLRNMEHIAAASAFVQSLILAAENAGYKTYWSSGGPLKGQAVFDLLDIPLAEILLGAILLFPDSQEAVEVKSGSMADKRGKLKDWSTWVSV